MISPKMSSVSKFCDKEFATFFGICSYFSKTLWPVTSPLRTGLDLKSATSSCNPLALPHPRDVQPSVVGVIHSCDRELWFGKSQRIPPRGTLMLCNCVQLPLQHLSEPSCQNSRFTVQWTHLQWLMDHPPQRQIQWSYSVIWYPVGYLMVQDAIWNHGKSKTCSASYWLCDAGLVA